jgi:hypothetical protein
VSSIPLPALDVNTQQRDPLEAYSRLVQLRTMAQQQQLQQGQIQLQRQAIRDQQALTQAFQQWDPQKQTYDDLAKSVTNNGGSGNAALQIQQHALTIKKTVSDIAAQDATTGSKNLETFIGKHKTIGSTIEAAENVPDEQLHGHVLSAISDLANGGVLEPQAAQGLAQQVQSTPDPKALRTAMDQFAKVSMGAIAAAEEAKTQAATYESTQKGFEAQQTGQQKAAQTAAYQGNGMVPGISADEQAALNYMRTVPGANPANYPAWKAQQEAIATGPQKIQVAQAEAGARVAAENSPQAIAGAVNKKLAVDAATGANEQVYATNRAGQTTLMTKGDAIGQGFGYSKVGTKQIAEDRQLNNRLADVTQKIAQYEQSFQQPLASNGWFHQSDHNLVAQVIGTDKLKLGAFGAELPVDWMNKLGRSSLFASMSPQAQQRVIAYFNAREAIQGYQRVLTGSGRSSDKSLELNLDTLPAPIDPENYAGSALKAFKQNLVVAGQGMPILPGVKTPGEIEQQINTR